MIDEQGNYYWGQISGIRFETFSDFAIYFGFVSAPSPQLVPSDQIKMVEPMMERVYPSYVKNCLRESSDRSD